MIANIYQTSGENAFRRYEDVSEPRFKDYKHVGSLELKQCRYKNINIALEEVFLELNINKPKDFKGRSLSVSDIVEINNEYYYCDSFGWVAIKV